MPKGIEITDQEDLVKSFMFECPGCKGPHSVNYENKSKLDLPVWQFNHNFEKPTFVPSLKVRWPANEFACERICHSYIRDGKMEFLGDCTHDLAGQTVEIPEWED